MIKRYAGCSDAGSIDYRAFNIETALMMEERFEDTRRSLYNQHIYLTREELNDIYFKENNNIDYSLYIDDLNKGKLRRISQKDLEQEYKNKCARFKKLYYCSMFLFAVIELAILISDFHVIPMLMGTAIVTGIFLTVQYNRSLPLTYDVVFKDDGNEEFL